MRTVIRTLLWITALGICVGQSLAVTPHLFIGGNAQWNEPTGDFGEASDEVQDDFWNGNANGVLGGQADVGVISDNGQIYLGYRIVDFDEKDSEGDVEWRNNSRWVFGLRWHMLGTLQTPITPVLGGGLTVGQTEGIFKGPTGEVIAELTSDNTWGWFFEAGAAVRIPDTPLGFNGLIQYNRYTATFEDEEIDVEFRIAYLIYQLGAQIYF